MPEPLPVMNSYDKWGPRSSNYWCPDCSVSWRGESDCWACGKPGEAGQMKIRG
jgi:hypothetical protein